MTTTTPNRTTSSNYSNSPVPYTGFDRLFIGGRWFTVRSEHKLQPINPYRQDAIVEIPAADKRGLEDAYQQAQRTQAAWAEALPRDSKQPSECSLWWRKK
ncbi:hypothetical protein IQ277_09020 [Nostocales cyanobacterium LEGE 12452]|nr:hypothetical protein [Nostocales cyanobacterium LEGE 12452]